MNLTPKKKLNRSRALITEWRSVDMLFQLTGGDLIQRGKVRLASSGGRVDNITIESYLFFAIDLKGHAYTRTQLASITREVNKRFPMPVMFIFRHGKSLTIAIIDRRPNKGDESKDVLLKVTLIKDINTSNPHRAHVEILSDLSLPALEDKYSCTNFVDLHRAWQGTLNSSELNKRFFEEVANWYFWALEHVVFPKGAGLDKDARNATSVIRMNTRLIFCWFLKEKGLIPDSLFSPQKLKNLLKDAETLPVSNETRYYKAILQNLFFATLNGEMNDPAMPRKFRGKNKGGGQHAHYLVSTVYRYADMFLDAKRAFRIFWDSISERGLV